MDPPHLDREAILRQYDSLRQAGQLLYTPSTSVIRLVDEGFQFEFRVTPAQKTKPSFPEDDQKSSSAKASEGATGTNGQARTAGNRGISPYPTASKAGSGNQANGDHAQNSQDNSTPHSDIDDNLPEWHIAHVNKTHRLIHNKYCIYRPQYILLTADPLKRQTVPLEASDFLAAWTALRALDDATDDQPRKRKKKRHYVIFNCAKQAGGSRLHKHMQIFEESPSESGGDRHEEEEGTEEPPLELLPDRLLRDPPTTKTVPYTYFLSDTRAYDRSGDGEDDGNTAASHQLREYKAHVRQCATALSASASNEASASGVSDAVIPHNVIMTRRWIMTIPRRAAGIGAATANAAGFLGLVWVPEESAIDFWRGLGPARVLARLGVPSS